MVSVLKQEEDAIQDGMDLAIYVIDKKSKNVVFSGARNGLFIVNKVEMYVNIREITLQWVEVISEKKNLIKETYHTAQEFSLQ